MPSGLKIRSVIPKGQNAQGLQEKFNAIIKEAELKLLDAAIEALCTGEQRSFQFSDPSFDIVRNKFVMSAKCFADNFYFECAKCVVDNIERSSTEAKRTEQRESEFKPDE